MKQMLSTCVSMLRAIEARTKEEWLVWDEERNKNMVCYWKYTRVVAHRDELREENKRLRAIVEDFIKGND